MPSNHGAGWYVTAVPEFWIREGEKGIRDEAISGDGRYLYAIDADAQKLCGWAVGQGGQLRPVGEFSGVPDTVAGLAAS